MSDRAEYDRKFQAALAELKAAGLSNASANPPMVRLVRALGIKVRPPLYMEFRQLACFMGLPFGLFWGCFMYVFFWRTDGVSSAVALGSSVLAAVLFGVGMAWFLMRQRRNLDITAWDGL